MCKWNWLTARTNEARNILGGTVGSLGEVGRPKAGESEDEEVHLRGAGKRGVDELDVGERSCIQRAAP